MAGGRAGVAGLRIISPREGAGVPIERVSILLGHQSARITEKHYAPWVRSRQEQLEADLANAWSRDPLVLLQSGVHQRYTEMSGQTTLSSSIRKTGARGGSRTHMRKNPRRILSPQRLPFRHPGTGITNLTKTSSYCNTTSWADGCSICQRRSATVLCLQR